MIGLARLFIGLMIVLTIIYWCLVFYFRAGERDRLEKEWHETQPPLPMERFVENGIEEYKSSLRRKLLWGVYIVPIGLICGLVYLINFH